MYRFLLRPKWIAFHVLVAAAVVVMINLGFWQLRRLDERRDFNRAVTERIEQPPASIDELLAAGTTVGDDELETLEWRPVELSGRYVPGEEIRVYNRSQGGVAGENVVTPLQLDDERLVLVVRGFVPLDTDVAAPPEGDVTVVGRLRTSEEHRRGRATDPASGELAEVGRLDIDRLAPQLPGDVVPMFVELTSSDPAESGPFPIPVAEPELTERNHLSYAVQWYIFSACAVAGWILAVRRSAQNASRHAARSIGP